MASLLAVVSLSVYARAADTGTVLVPAASTWRYLPGLGEASAPDPTAWRTRGVDDASWPARGAPIGFGPNVGVVATDLAREDPPMRHNFSCFFLRREFQVTDPLLVGDLRASVRYDDGVILWLNGVELYRGGVSGTPGELVAADAVAVSSHDSSVVVDVAIPRAEEVLHAGTNVLAAQVFNSSLISTDVYFDLALLDAAPIDTEAPEVAWIEPPPGSRLQALGEIHVMFDRLVTGVDGSDLVVGGSPAVLAARGGLAPYVFAVPHAVGPGEVTVEWSPEHGIVDLGRRLPNPFAGGSWTYTVDPSLPAAHPVISEFLAVAGADGSDSLRDDWIEVYNPGSGTVALGGWTISDSRDSAAGWTFPPVSLGPFERVVVMASGGDDRGRQGELHASFRLASSGEYLGLFPPGGEIAVSEYAPRYPPQRPGRSFGRGPAGVAGYFAEPTPGTPNVAALYRNGFAPDPRISVERGVFDDPFVVELSSAIAGSEIRYTLDGSPPGPEHGSTYTEGLLIAPARGAAAAVLRAVALADGYLPSRVITHTYIFRGRVLAQGPSPEGFPPSWGSRDADYAVDPGVVAVEPAALDGITSIPSLALSLRPEDLFGVARGIYANPEGSGRAWERSASAELLLAGGAGGTSADCGLRVQGSSSVFGWNTPKLSLRLAFRGEYGASELRFRLYEDAPVRSFETLVADAGHHDTVHQRTSERAGESQYVRDQVTADLQIEAGGPGPHGRFVHLYLNGVYWGIYGLHERPDAAFAATRFGGEPEDYDAIRHRVDEVVDGENGSYTRMLAAVREAEPGVREDYVGLAERLDAVSFADYMLVNFYAGNDDWSAHNWYATSRRPDGPVRFHSWDAEFTFARLTDSALHRNERDTPTGIFAQLERYPEFRLLFADRAHRHIFAGGMLDVAARAPGAPPDAPSVNRPAEIYLRRIEEIREAVILEYARWGDSRRVPGFTPDDWRNELDRLLTEYFPERSARLLEQLRRAGLYPELAAPVLSQGGGRVAPGFALELSAGDEAAAGAAILYTLDGSDPRTFWTGEPSPQAVEYSGPIVLAEPTVVKARARRGEEWSALAEAQFTLAGAPPGEDERRVVVSEIHFDPREGAAFEFLEFWNPTNRWLDLSGARFTGGIGHVFARGTMLRPGAHLVLVSDPFAFASLHPGVDPAGVFTGRLDNDGEELRIADADGRTLLRLEYRGDDAYWPFLAGGFGHSLVLAEAFGDLDDPRAWRASSEVGGSPGRADAAERSPFGLIVSEVATRAALGRDAIELTNLGGRAFGIGGWSLSPAASDAAALRGFRLPAAFTVPAHGRLVLEEADFHPQPGREGGFVLSEEGGTLHLVAPADEADLAGHGTRVEYGAAEPDRTWGLVETSTGPVFTLLERPTLGEENAEARAAEVVINEIHVRPRDGESEFIELHNPGAREITVGGWSVSGIRDAGGTGDYVMPEGVTIAPGGFIVIVPITPALFRTLAGVPEDALVVGPYGGALDADGERIALWKLAASGARLLIDEVRYRDREPWPFEELDAGATLDRVRADAYGGEALHWDASLERGGTPGRANSTAPPAEGGRVLPGDASGDGRLDILDGLVLANVLMGFQSAATGCTDTTALLDANGDRTIDLADAAHVLRHLFLDGDPHVLGTDCVVVAGCAEACR